MSFKDLVLTGLPLVALISLIIFSVLPQSHTFQRMDRQAELFRDSKF